MEKPFNLRKVNYSASFTLIELLIVIGIIAIISVVVIVVLNPQELIKQARDSTRFSDMAVLERSLSIFEVDRSTSFAGTSTVVYVSVPDTSSTCANLGLPSLPSGWTYNCASTSTLQNVDGTGWIPANLTSISTGSPIDRLPIDPVNTTSSFGYYTYTKGSTGLEIGSFLESEKHLNKMWDDGGDNVIRFEKGSNLSAGPSGKILWLKADAGVVTDGSGVNQWSDQSGLNNHATQSTASLKPSLLQDQINGKPALSFNVDQLDVPSLSTVAPSESDVFIVASSSVSINDGVNNGGPFDAGNGNGNFNIVYPFGDGSLYLRNFGGGGLVFSPTLDVDVPRLVELSSRSGAHIRRLDTVEQISLGGAYTAPSVVRLGNISGGGTLYYSGIVSEVIFFSRILDSVERSAIEAYFKDRYSLSY